MMFQIHDKINKLHERALRIVYNDTVTSFEELLVKDKTFTIHHQNIQACDFSGFCRDSGFLNFFNGKSISVIQVKTRRKSGEPYYLHLFY